MTAPLLRTIPEIGNDVAAGLSRQPKSLPSHLFYDDEGSRLFEEITTLPEYYLTRTERQILEAGAGEMVEQAGINLSLLELGAGTAAKTGAIIHALMRRQLRVEFCPIDVCATALEIAQQRLKAEFPALKIRPLIADYSNGLVLLPPMPGRKLVLYLGSSIGNFEPKAASAMLRKLRKRLNIGDCLLLGTDLVKGASVLIPAYNDSRGTTAQFNKNVLARINRELGGCFDLRLFRHIAVWNPDRNRMEMYLESTRNQVVRIAALSMDVAFRAGERIHTENSYKYTKESVTSILSEGGFNLERTWRDPECRFAEHLARVA
jgi:L-histidine Nalpha-methyltransferase